MSQSQKSQQHLIANATARRKHLQTIAFSTTSSFTAFATTFAEDGSAFDATKSPLIVVQSPDADVYWRLGPSSTNVADGQYNATLIPSTQMDGQTATNADLGINAAGKTASGHLVVFVQETSL